MLTVSFFENGERYKTCELPSGSAAPPPPNIPSSTPVRALWANPEQDLLFFEKVRILPFSLLSLRGIPLKVVLLLPLSPSQAPGPTNSDAQIFYTLGVCWTVMGGRHGV